MRTARILITLTLAALAAAVPSAQQKPDAARKPDAAPAPVPLGVTTDKITVPLRFDHYYTYEQIGEALQALHAAYPQLTSVESVGKSEEGRDIWAMTVNNLKTGKAFDKPGVYVDGNIHGNEIQAAEVGLSLLNRLLTLYGRNDQITKIVDRNVFYVIPSVNVDGRHHFFNDANTPNSNRTIRVPRDDDRDGLVDEDGPDDLDGDGNISTMRRKDPFGRWKSDPEDPRLLVPIKPGEKGEWSQIGEEGIDNDGDGKVNEDAAGYLDGNRTWGINWAPPYVQSGSGEYPFQAAGPRAIAKFLTDRPNIIVVFAFHNSGGMFLRGPSTKAQEPMNPADIAVYDILGKHAEKIVPGYRYLVSWKDLYATYGDFTDFTDNVVGAFSFTGELFVEGSETYRQPPKPGQAAEPPADDDDTMMGASREQQRERLKFNDNVAQGELYRPWKPFKHPQFGDVEIGGWVKMSSRLPHPFMLTDLAHRNASAVIFAASQTPDISLDVLPPERIGGDLYKLRVRVVNAGSIPSFTYNAAQRKIHPQDTLTVGGKTVKVVSGGPVSGMPIEEVRYKASRPDVQFLHVPGNGRVEFQFLVTGSGEVSVTYQSLKAGKAQATVALR